ncbi:hypothetical protein SAMD00023353_1102350 [Rosellinia necatrix]|uniref:Uncharacterized protein n=1 Tax=Rosellinia necatrix TaxID=77044 RepID=A0A1S7UMV8_ROSNE|nr:hypothetical protein SAMD00023353_1102350 [Rosellinia necatrix]
MNPATNVNADDNIPITQRINKILGFLNLTQHILSPIGGAGCTLECYKDLMELPVACKVQHVSSCNCKEPDPALVREYLEKIYADGVEKSRFTSDGLRTFEWLIHELCNEFNDSVEGGFNKPTNVPRHDGEGR